MQNRRRGMEAVVTPLRLLVIGSDLSMVGWVAEQCRGRYRSLARVVSDDEKPSIDRFSFDVCIYVCDSTTLDDLKIIGEIKQQYAHIPILVITNQCSRDFAEQALSLEFGVDFILDQPFCMNELDQKIQYCLKHGGYKKALSILASWRKTVKESSDCSDKRRLRELRIQEILDLVESQPREWTYGKLSVRFGVDRRTIERDVNELRQRGHAIMAPKRGPYGLYLGE